VVLFGGVEMKKCIASFLASVFAFFGFVGSAFADSVDFSPLTDAIDFSGVTEAIMVSAGLLAGVYVVWKGASLILGALRRL
jgi:hypothetical protein